MPYDERVILVKHPHVGHKVFQEQSLDIVIFGILAAQTQPREKPQRIGIHNKSRSIQAVKKNGVGGFRPDPVKGKQFFS
jgi:hypothetical protein